MDRLRKMVWMAALVGVCLSLLAYVAMKTTIENYATTRLCQSLGNLPPSQKIEEKITALARTMGVTEKIIIKKMNPVAMRIYGYHNAFACYPTLLFGAITFNKPHMFISEGFFEDLLPEEQCFIIGHELAHIQKHHILYLSPFMGLFELLMLIFWWLVLVTYIKILAQRFNPAHQKTIRFTLITTSLIMCLGIPTMLELAYRRRIEREADIICVQALHCADGALKAFARWGRECKLPLHNNYYGIFSDHPSHFERKNYCLTCRQNDDQQKGPQ